MVFVGLCREINGVRGAVHREPDVFVGLGWEEQGTQRGSEGSFQAAPLSSPTIPYVPQGTSLVGPCPWATWGLPCAPAGLVVWSNHSFSASRSSAFHLWVYLPAKRSCFCTKSFTKA